MRLMFIIKLYVSGWFFVLFFFFPSLFSIEGPRKAKRRLSWKMRYKAFLYRWNFLKVLNILKLALLGVLVNMHVTGDKVSAGRSHTIPTADIRRR